MLSDALDFGGGLAVPVAWVKRTLCDVVQAREAHEVGVLLLEKYGRMYYTNTIHCSFVETVVLNSVCSCPPRGLCSALLFFLLLKC